MGQYFPLVIIGAGALVIFFPELKKLLGKVKLTRPQPVPPPVQEQELVEVDTNHLKVIHLDNLLDLREFLDGNSQAIECIDSTLVPAIMKAKVK